VYKVFVGTSGYSYEDWKENFYPPGLSSKEYLSYYSTVFNTVELNFTYYCQPNPYTFYSMYRKLRNPGEFVFSVKANSIFTHEREYNSEEVERFTGSLKPLIDLQCLGSILFQFPYSFSFSAENSNYVLRLGEAFSGFEICAEFRNKSWLDERLIENLRNSNIGFCNVDEPGLKGLIPPTSICTTGTGYIRFHGRNKNNWWESRRAWERYDYMYRQEEIAEWIPRVKDIRAKTKKIFIYFNNHYKGKAARSALMFLDLLKNSGVETGIGTSQK